MQILKIGDKAWYRGAFGADAPQLCTITGEGEKNGRLVYDCELAGGQTHWGYSDQFVRAEVLSGHVSQDTAYLVDDYPYGFRLRCQMRHWLEYKPGFGFRHVTQTSNPKKPGTWNKPKAGIYSKFGACLYLNENDHVACAGLSEYSTGAEAKAWSDKYRAGVPEVGLAILDKWVAAKIAYDANRQKNDPLNVGLPEARKAWNETP